MALTWQPATIIEPAAITIHQGECTIANDDELKRGVASVVEKATSLFPSSLQDDSQYLLFEWDQEMAILTVVVTDINKANDSSQKVQCQLSGAMLADAGFTEDFSYAVRDYLTTCASFMAYSMVAVFCDRTRTQCQLL
jgi:hypothetical protein